jgi:glycosyltransferase involved in cell wall biosynthesis
MKLSKTTVTVGLPVYNGERYLKGALESILRQTYEDFELVISDNASTDLTEGRCRDYSKSDSRIRYLRSEASRAQHGITIRK